MLISVLCVILLESFHSLCLAFATLLKTQGCVAGINFKALVSSFVFGQKRYRSSLKYVVTTKDLVSTQQQRDWNLVKNANAK
jgi:hypothetical protein